MSDELRAEGFPGQRLVVLPRPLVAAALGEPLTRQLLITDCGYFPFARRHGMNRPQAIEQAVILLCAAGRGFCQIGDEEYEIRAGQAAILPPGAPHTYRADPADPWTLWWVHVAGESVPGFLDAAQVSEDFPVREITGFSRAVELIDESIDLLENDLSATGVLGGSGIAWHLLSLLSLTVNRVDRHAELVHDVQSYVQDNMSRTLSVADLARHARMSPSHFSSVFRDQSGASVMHYVTQIRMAKARELLDATGASIGEIAERCGFNDALYFSRRFSAFHGMSPSAYRAQEKG